MRIFISIVVVVVTIAVALVLGVSAAKYLNKKHRADVHRAVIEKMDDLKVGDKLPDWTFENLKFEPEKLSGHISGPTMLIFIQPNCPGCLDDMDRLSAIISDSALCGRVVFISGDNPRELMDVRDQFNIRSAILYDHERSFAWQLGINTFPFHIIVDNDRTVLRMIPATLSEEEISEIFAVSP